MLQELIKYSYENKKKFDIVAAMGMAELGDEEMAGSYLKERLSTKMSEKTLDDIKMKEELLDMELFLNKIL